MLVFTMPATPGKVLAVLLLVATSVFSDGEWLSRSADSAELPATSSQVHHDQGVVPSYNTFTVFVSNRSGVSVTGPTESCGADLLRPCLTVYDYSNKTALWQFS
eukprot:scpid93298/ scgid18058/ 